MKAEKIDSNHVWRFVEKYYPDYAHSDEILRSCDLQKILDNEMDEGSHAEKIFHEEFAGSIGAAGDAYDTLHKEIYEAAIQNYIQQHNKLVDIVNEMTSIDLKISNRIQEIKELLNQSQA